MACRSSPPPPSERSLDRGGDYLLALKDNQSNLHDEVRRYLEAALIHGRFETTDGDHGRVEVRRHVVSHDVDWLTTARHFPGEPRFPGLRAIAVVAAEVERNGGSQPAAIRCRAARYGNRPPHGDEPSPNAKRRA